MHAAVVHRYGPPEVVSVLDRPLPQPRRGEVRVRVTAAAVSSGDARIRAARFPPGFAVPARLALGLRGPRRPVLGVALAGTVDALGEGVERLAVGDEVAGMTGARFGAHAQFACVPAGRLVTRPTTVGDEAAAAALFGGTTALHFLRKGGGLTAGARVLVNGGAGSVGSAAVQLARHAGASVTAVAGPKNHELMRRWADEVVDHTRTPVAGLTARFDLVVDAVGTLTRRQGLALLTPDGSLAQVAAGLGDLLRARGRVLAGTAPEDPADIRQLLALVADGSFDPLTEVVGDLTAVPDAHRRIDTGHKTGNLIVLPHG